MITTHAELLDAAHTIRVSGHGLLVSQLRLLGDIVNYCAAQDAIIADLRAALTEAHQHAEVLQTKLDELTKESET